MPPLARNRELEAAIVANPDDRDSWAVYCDWLEAQGDPRAELMRWQLKQEDKSAKWLRRVIDEVFARVAPVLIGELGRRAADDGSVTPHGPLSWRSGFVYGVRLRHTLPDLAKLLAELLAHPSCFALREIQIAPPHHGYRPQVADVRAVVGAMVAGAPPTVRVVHLACECDAPGAAKLARLPRLEELRLGAPSGPALAGETVRAIGSAPWRALRRLQLGSGSSDASAADFAPLLARADLALDELRLEGAHGGHGLVQLLVDSPLATRVERLAVMFELGQADYERLLANRTRFAARELWVRDPAWAERLALRPNANV